MTLGGDRRSSPPNPSACRRDGDSIDADPSIPPEPGHDSAADDGWFLGAATSTGMRFHVLRPHAQGGIGKVSVAFDAELQREVALKQIKPERADDADSRARFLLEAEVTGRLEHPGIVPVYGLGADEQGRPFYAMRFVRGTSLEEAIRHYHRCRIDTRRNARARALELRQLLDRFADVCHTVAYAHSRGVLHRDLKPANILLGPFNESLVVDWGLAKVLGRSPSPRKPPSQPAPAMPLQSNQNDVDADLPMLGRHGGRPGTGSERARRRPDRGFELDRHAGGDGVRHTGLHEPGAGRGTRRPARPGERRLQPGGRALHPPLRQGPV